MTHSVNRCNAEYASAADLIEALTARVTTLEQQMLETQAMIGRVRDEMEQTIEKMRAAYKHLKNGVREGGD
jgi:prefoldin subunit 5